MLRIRIIIFSYQREKMLKALIQEIKAFSSLNITYSIIDDGSDFTMRDNFYQFEHGGKPQFWKMWDYALRMLKDDHSDLFIFMPSDVSQLNLNKIIIRHNQFKHNPYAYNLINDGRENCWNLTKPVKLDAHTIKVGFTDCGFFCNKSLLTKIGHFMNEVNPARFEHNENISSGVGQQLTFRMRRAMCSIYTPVHSLVYHGPHISLMHPKERIKTPLISK